jgi:hypothetical protein
MASTADNGLITVLSSHSFERTVTRLEEELRATGIKLSRRFCIMRARCPHLDSNPFKGLQSSTMEGKP